MTKILYFITVFLNVTLSCCKQKEYKEHDNLCSIVKNVDQLEIYYYRKYDTSKFTLYGNSEINKITLLIDGEVTSDTQNCKPSGHIIYLKSNKVVFESLFSIGNSNSVNCEQLTYYFYPYKFTKRLTYQAGMLLDEFSRSAMK